MVPMTTPISGLVPGRDTAVRVNFVLIDFENIQPESLAVLDKDHFRVFIFVGASQTKVPFEVAAMMQRLGARAEYIKIAGNGPNALDFHIAYYIGHLAAADPSAYFHIVSRDTGFDPLIKYLRGKNVYAMRSKSIGDIPCVKAAGAQSPDQRLAVLIEKLQKSKATKPKTVKTLASTVASLFQKTLAEQDVASLVTALQNKGLIVVTDKKITYSLPPGD